ncbi:MAG: hypothetical protein GY950_05360 [bacterium]|nr:hypothetical protein [bacterium]
MNWNRTVKFLFMALFLLLQVYLVFVKDFQVPDYDKYFNEFPQPLFRENGKRTEVSQTFRTPGPLARIDILLANYKIKPKSGTLQLGIFKNGRCLFLKKYPANTAEDNRFYNFAVDADKVPPGAYTLKLKHFPGDKKERLAVWIYQKDIYPYGELFVDGKLKKGDMTFRVYFFSTLWEQRARLSGPLLFFGLVLLLFALNFLFYHFCSMLLH